MKTICSGRGSMPYVQGCDDAAVRLLPGTPFYDAQERMKEYLLSVEDDRMLYNFRRASGLDTGDAEPLDGWETWESQIRGHTTGHYMSALALCYHATGDVRFKEKAVYMVESLRKCQEAFSRMEGVGEGFLSGYLPNQFDQLEEYVEYPAIWAPYYTLHKIFAGLLDCYTYIGEPEALAMSERLGLWVWRRLSKLPYQKRTKMWGMYIAGEFGAMNVIMAQLYMLTGREEFIDCAKLFDNKKLNYPLEQKQDKLDGMHANQHIPQMLGALEIYKAAGEKRYYDMAKFFWQTVTDGHVYAPGGCGESEKFFAKDRIGDLLTEKTQETCASYNMLKLTRELFGYEPKSRYMDYYERTVLNHILASQDKRPTGESTYFFPLEPGARREFLRENSCCHGTGMESHFKYREGIYSYREDEFYVNLFIPSVLDWDDRDVHIRQEAVGGRPERTRLSVKGSGIRTLKVRLPQWAVSKNDTEGCDLQGRSFVIEENGAEIAVWPDEDGYLTFDRDFSEEIVYEAEFAFRFRIIRPADIRERAAVAYGPYIMAALSEEKGFLDFPFTEEDIEEKMIPSGDGLTFTCEGIRWIPLCMVDEEAYHVYGIAGDER